MRGQLLRLKNANKAERRIGEILKRNHFKFKSRWRVGKYECDFIVGRVVIEVDGKIHFQTNAAKDTYLVSRGYVPIHISAYSKDLKIIEKELLSLIELNDYGHRHIY